MEESFGALLTRIRLARGWSQLRVAELLCAASSSPTVTRHEVSRWEREERVPSGFWLGWLAFVCEVPVAELRDAARRARRHRRDGPEPDAPGWEGREGREGGEGREGRMWPPGEPDGIVAGSRSG